MSHGGKMTRAFGGHGRHALQTPDMDGRGIFGLFLVLSEILWIAAMEGFGL